MCSVALPVDDQPHSCWDNLNHSTSRSHIMSSSLSRQRSVTAHTKPLLRSSPGPSSDTYHIVIPHSPGRCDPPSHPSLPSQASRNSPGTFAPGSPRGEGVRPCSGCNCRVGIHTTLYCDDGTHPSLRIYSYQLGGVQVGGPLHLLSARFHRRHRRYTPHRPVCHGHDLVPGNCISVVTPHPRGSLLRLFFGRRNYSWQV